MSAAEAIMSVQALSIRLNNSVLVDNVSFELYPGKTTALVGESGSGKSLTAQSILKLLPDYMHCQGNIHFDQQNLLDAPASIIQSIRGDKIAMIFQEPMTALNPLQTVEQQIRECFPSANKQPKAAVIDLLTKVQIDQPASKLKAFPHQLSGGQRQRVMIAMALANQPDILIADEPTTALDVTVQKEILDLLANIQQQDNLAILLISHDIHVVEKYSDYVAVMQSGSIVEAGDSQQIFNHAQHAYTQSLIDDIEIPKPNPHGQSVILSTSGLSCRYQLPKTSWFRKDFQQALNNVDIKLHAGEILGVIGESGSGKTTLANALLKLVPASGQYSIDGNDMLQLSSKAFRPFRQWLQVVFQDPFASLSPRMTVAAIISEGYCEMLKQQQQHISDDALSEKIRWALSEVGLNDDILERYPHEFSGGQRQRIALARAIIMQPKCIILDEPTSALDRNIQQQVLRLIIKLQHDLNISFIIISHDLLLVRQMCHNLIILNHGNIVESGATEGIFLQPENPYTQRLIASHPSNIS
ncbi:MAG: ABC transporter ATP-binding protein [Pseudomonadales bacterium]|nr:ABC transporter ATP-binding protein [Pseudomonadales bacterium]